MRIPSLVSDYPLSRIISNAFWYPRQSLTQTTEKTPNLHGWNRGPHYDPLILSKATYMVERHTDTLMLERSFIYQLLAELFKRTTNPLYKKLTNIHHDEVKENARLIVAAYWVAATRLPRSDLASHIASDIHQAMAGLRDLTWEEKKELRDQKYVEDACKLRIHGGLVAKELGRKSVAVRADEAIEYCKAQARKGCPDLKEVEL